MKEYRYYIFAPAGLISGGPELAHQMCNELLLRERQAYMFYVYRDRKEPFDMPVDVRYQKYGTSHVKDMCQVEREDSIIIVPEGLASWSVCYNKCRKVLWWMSVDSYFAQVRLVGRDFFDLIQDQVSLHLVQSYYAYQFLLERGISPRKILRVSDYISENYGKLQFPKELRQNIALYNPKKGLEEVKPLIKKIKWLKWIPLNNLTEAQMIAIMNVAKVYVDFGCHPGKDRIPREAASCGCCIITNKKGSAAFYEDVPIPDCYKIEDVSKGRDKIEELLWNICLHWEEHNKSFEKYRAIIEMERKKFSEDVKYFIEIIENLEKS